MYKGFRSYELSVELYHECKKAQLPYYLKDQLLRASSSVCLNLSEGSAKVSKKERIKFYTTSLASLREIQTIIDLEKGRLDFLFPKADILGAHLYRLCRMA